MSDQQQTVWACKIGFIGQGTLPMGADAPMREAVRNAFGEMFEAEPEFIFSGWAAKLTEAELAVVENRLPSHASEAKSYEALLAERDALREALDGCYALAIGHAGTYQFNHGEKEIHPTHQAILDAAKSALSP